MENLETFYKDKALELLESAFNQCLPEILFLNSDNVKIYVPKYFYDFITDNDCFKYMGYPVQIGYENSIVIFDQENGFTKNRVFKYAL